MKQKFLTLFAFVTLFLLGVGSASAATLTLQMTGDQSQTATLQERLGYVESFTFNGQTYTFSEPSAWSYGVVKITCQFTYTAGQSGTINLKPGTTMQLDGGWLKSEDSKILIPADEFYGDGSCSYNITDFSASDITPSYDYYWTMNITGREHASFFFSTDTGIPSLNNATQFYPDSETYEFGSKSPQLYIFVQPEDGYVASIDGSNKQVLPDGITVYKMINPGNKTVNINIEQGTVDPNKYKRPVTFNLPQSAPDLISKVTFGTQTFTDLSKPIMLDLSDIIGTGRTSYTFNMSVEINPTYMAAVNIPTVTSNNISFQVSGTAENGFSINADITDAQATALNGIDVTFTMAQALTFTVNVKGAFAPGAVAVRNQNAAGYEIMPLEAMTNSLTVFSNYPMITIEAAEDQEAYRIASVSVDGVEKADYSTPFAAANGMVIDVTLAGNGGELVFDDITIDYVKGAEGVATTGDDNSIVIDLETATSFEYSGFQFDIQLPEWLTLAPKTEEGSAAALNEAFAKGSIYYAPLKDKDNTYRVVANLNEATFAEEGLATLTLTYNKEDLKPGIYKEVYITNVIFSSPKGEDIENIGGSTGTVIVEDVTNYTTGVTIEDVEIAAPSSSEVPFTEQENPNITQGEELDFNVELTTKYPGQEPDEDVTFNVTINGVQAEDGSQYVKQNEDGSYYFDSSALGEIGEGESVEVTIVAVSGDAESEELTFTVRGVRLGDANDNEVVTVADVVTTANYIVTPEPLPVMRFDFPNANVILTEVDGEQVINSQDVTAIVNIVLGVFNPETDRYQSARRNPSILSVNDALVADNFKSGMSTIGVRLDNSRDYSAIQAVVEIPEGMEVTGVYAGPRAASHNLTYRVLDNGNVAFILYSLSNSAFAESNDALVYIDVMAAEHCESVNIVSILASDARSNGFSLDFNGGLNETGTTGLTGIEADEQDARYFTVDGVEVFNPEKGQILIRIQNGKALKVVK